MIESGRIREAAVTESNPIEIGIAPLAIGSEEFRAMGYQLIDRIAGFLGSLPERPVTRGESPSDIRKVGRVTSRS